MDALEEIFSAFRYRQSASNFALEMRQRDQNPSLVVSDEFKEANFHKSNIDNLKLLLEGKGGLVEHKGIDPIVAYKNANFFLCSQYPHPILTKELSELSETEKY